MGAVFYIWHNLSTCSAIRPQLIGNHALWGDALLLQQTLQQANGRFGIAAGLNNLVQNSAVLVHRSPQPMLLSVDGDDDFIHVPDIIRTWCFAAQATRVVGAEFVSPTTDCFV